MSRGPANTARISPPTSSSADDLASSLSASNARLSEQVNRAVAIADSYFGGAPTGALGNGRLNEAPSSKTGRLSQLASEYADLAEALSQALDRLSCI
jgi:hypothetical protein